MSEEKNLDRRRFLGTAALAVAAAQFGTIGSAEAESRKAAPITRFDALKQIDAGVLNVGYAEAPASDGTSYSKKFSGKRTHPIINGVGHNLPQEAPRAFAEAVMEVDGF